MLTNIALKYGNFECHFVHSFHLGKEHGRRMLVLFLVDVPNKSRWCWITWNVKTQLQYMIVDMSLWPSMVPKAKCTAIQMATYNKALECTIYLLWNSFLFLSSYGDIQWLVGKLRTKQFRMMLVKRSNLAVSRCYKHHKLQFWKEGVSFLDSWGIRRYYMFSTVV